jgi:YbgC/YbaW family acyl-CoA thioester hydrolase
VGASITLQRRLEWLDTDAGVRWHHATIWRYAEWAEAELHRRLGIIDTTFGYTPRRRLEAEFFRPLRFDELVTVTFSVTEVGRTSATYDVTLATDAGPAATARMVVVLVDDEGRPTPWPEELAAALRE